mgnify:CR=1 FL=1
MDRWQRIESALRAYRARSGLTQQGLADRAGVSLSIINRLESGREPRSDYSQRTVARVAQAIPRGVGEVLVTELGFDAGYFVYEDDSEAARQTLLRLLDGMNDDELRLVRSHIEWVISQRD